MGGASTLWVFSFPSCSLPLLLPSPSSSAFHPLPEPPPPSRRGHRPPPPPPLSPLGGGGGAAWKGHLAPGPWGRGRGGGRTCSLLRGQRQRPVPQGSSYRRPWKSCALAGPAPPPRLHARLSPRAPQTLLDLTVSSGDPLALWGLRFRGRGETENGLQRGCAPREPARPGDGWMWR